MKDGLRKIEDGIYETEKFFVYMIMKDFCGTEEFSFDLKNRYNSGVGRMAVKPDGEICYAVNDAYAGAGYGTQILAFAKEYARKKGLDPFLRIRKDNIASQKVAKRNHFSAVSSEGKYEVWKYLGESS